jgi:hypothetical protein
MEASVWGKDVVERPGAYDQRRTNSGGDHQIPCLDRRFDRGIILFAIIICSFWLPVAALREVCKNNYSVVASTGRNDRIRSPEPRQDAGFNFFR